VAFEVARQLRALGEEVELVLIFDGVLPSGVIVDHRQQLGHWLRSVVASPRTGLRQLHAHGNALESRLRLEWHGWWSERGAPGAARPGPSAADAAATAPELNVLSPEAVQMVRNYERMTGPLHVPVVLVRAQRRKLRIGERVRTDLGWAPHAPLLISWDVDCEHSELLQEPHVRQVADIIDGIQLRRN
jgi:thioesterase domain-containing protein